MEKDWETDKNYSQIKIAGINLGMRPAIPPENMGVKPGPGDLRNGFALPNFGPKRGTFWEVDGLKEYLVVSAESPEEFYIQNPAEKAELEELELRMTQFYDHYWTYHQKMTKEDMVIGGFYAYYSERYETWYRCRVMNYVMATTKDDPDQVVLQLLDYGTHEIGTLDHTYPLRPEFLELQTQVCHARLYANTKEPVEWTPEERMTFVKDIEEKVIRGYAVSYKIYPTETFIHVKIVVFNKDGSFLLGDRLNLNDPVEKIMEETAMEAKTEQKVETEEAAAI